MYFRPAHVLPWVTWGQQIRPYSFALVLASNSGVIAFSANSGPTPARLFLFWMRVSPLEPIRRLHRDECENIAKQGKIGFIGVVAWTVSCAPVHSSEFGIRTSWVGFNVELLSVPSCIAPRDSMCCCPQKPFGRLGATPQNDGGTREVVFGGPAWPIEDSGNIFCIQYFPSARFRKTGQDFSCLDLNMVIRRFSPPRKL